MKKLVVKTFYVFVLLLSVLLIASCDPPDAVADDAPSQEDVAEPNSILATFDSSGGETDVSVSDTEDPSSGSNTVVNNIDGSGNSNVNAVVSILPPESVKLDKESLSLVIDQTVTITATVSPVSAYSRIDWSLSGEDKDKVTFVGNSNDGTCTITNNGCASGSCTVTATSAIDKNKSASCEIKLTSNGVLSIATDTFLGIGNIHIASDVEIPIKETVTLSTQIDFDKSDIKSYSWEMEGEDSDCINLYNSSVDSCTLYAQYKITEEAKIRLVITLKNESKEYSNWCNITTKE